MTGDSATAAAVEMLERLGDEGGGAPPREELSVFGFIVWRKNKYECLRMTIYSVFSMMYFVYRVVLYLMLCCKTDMDTLIAVFKSHGEGEGRGGTGECKKAINSLEAKNIIQVFRQLPIYCITANF